MYPPPPTHTFLKRPFRTDFKKHTPPPSEVTTFWCIRPKVEKTLPKCEFAPCWHLLHVPGRYVTDSNRPQPLWQPPPTACPTASGAASEVPLPSNASLVLCPSQRAYIANGFSGTAHCLRKSHHREAAEQPRVTTKGGDPSQPFPLQEQNTDTAICVDVS